MRFEFIDAQKALFPVEFMCEQLGVSRSGFYAWKIRPESARQQEEKQLAEEVRASREVAKVITKHTKAAKKAAVAPETGATTTQEERGLDPTTGQGTEDMAKGADPSTTSTQLKWLHNTKRTGPWKKTKASKLDSEPITLIEANLYNIGDIVREVTREVLQEAMVE